MPHTFSLSLPSSEDFSLAQTFDCGQAFRFSPLPDGAWQGVALGRSCVIEQDGRDILLTCSCEGGCEALWRDYLDLGRDYSAIKAAFCRDETLTRAVSYCPGMRLLRQEPWEALCSFIISQNNNIPRIKGIIARLCELLGEQLPGAQYAFPGPLAIAGKTPEDLAPLRAGFRAKYLIDAANKIASGAVVLEQIKTLPCEEAKSALMAIQGVGPKVADCVLLYGMARVECVPRDVWIKRAMAVLYPGGFPHEFAPVAGIAQQYLFHYCRTCPGALTAAASI